MECSIISWIIMVPKQTSLEMQWMSIWSLSLFDTMDLEKMGFGCNLWFHDVVIGIFSTFDPCWQHKDGISEMRNSRQSLLFSSYVLFLIKERTNRPSKFLLCIIRAEKLEWMMCWWWIGLLPCKLYSVVPLVTTQDVAAFFFYLMI